jgi:hypothetical protein
MGLMMILSPLLLGDRFSLNKYFVAFGVVVLCLGLSFLLHGAIDVLRGSGGKRS